MPSFRRIRQASALLPCLICLASYASAPVGSGGIDPVPTAKIEVGEQAIILVPVTINGSGPYAFMLDTGASRTMLDQKLADELALPQLRKMNAQGVLTSSSMSVVHANSVSVAGAAISDLDLGASDHRLSVNPRVRGVLGEDFLRNFEVLIDYRHQVLQLGADTFAETALGERLSLQSTEGQLSGGQRTSNRLIVSGRIPDLGNKAMSLLVDSGANYLTLFDDHAAEITSTPNVSVKAGAMDSWTKPEARTRTVRSLYLGRNSVSELTIVEMSHVQHVDTDGLMPTSLFHSILISHRGKYVVLNPSFPKAHAPSATELSASVTPKN